MYVTLLVVLVYPQKICLSRYRMFLFFLRCVNFVCHVRMKKSFAAGFVQAVSLHETPNSLLFPLKSHHRIFSRKTWRRAFHRGNLLLALASGIASNNIADVQDCFKTAHFLHHHCMSWHTQQSYMPRLHSKAT